MLKSDPDDRISIDDVLTSSWLLQNADADADAATTVRAKWSELMGDGTATLSAVNASLAPDLTLSVPAAAATHAAPTIALASTAEPLGAKRKRDATVQAKEHCVARTRDRTALAATAAVAPCTVGNVDGAVTPPVALPGASSLDEATQEGDARQGGVNGLLVRSLGWVQLPHEKEKMVGDVATALTRLGIKYSIERGELADVVWARGEPQTGVAVSSASANATTADAADEGGAGSWSTGQLTVRIRIHQAQNVDGSPAPSRSDLHLSRHSGDILQFHSFYRDIRNKLSGANGWSHELGRYSMNVPHCPRVDL